MKDVWPDAVRFVMSGAAASALTPAALPHVTLADLAKARLLHRAAAALPMAAQPQRRLPSLPSRRAICPASVMPFLSGALHQQPFHAVLPEFLQLLAQRRWRLPPEWLPQVLDVMLKEDIPIWAFRSSLGPVVLWLAAQHPRWRRGVFPDRHRKVGRTSPLPPPAAVLRVQWPNLPFSIWERCVRDLARHEQAWASEGGALYAALAHSRYPWPDEVLLLWSARWKSTNARPALQVSAHERALLRAAALHASPTRLLAVMEEASAWPYAWRDLCTWAREVASFRLRMHGAFEQT